MELTSEVCTCGYATHVWSTSESNTSMTPPALGDNHSLIFQAGPGHAVQLFTRIQMTLADSFMQQLDWVGVACGRLHLLLENMQLSLSPTRMPPANMLSCLWNATTNLKV